MPQSSVCPFIKAVELEENEIFVSPIVNYTFSALPNEGIIWLIN